MFDVVRDPEIMIPMFCGWYNQIATAEPDERKQAVIDAIKAGTSITQAAKDAGVTRQTASKWWNDEKAM
jgi:DNA invertase Pin-like site-specific DNA recombinase